MTIKRCIFGGLFDPVHKAHIQTAIDVKKAFNIDFIHLIPTFNPPHRVASEANFEQRCEMLKLASESLSGFIVDKTEQLREDKSYSFFTLLKIKEQYPKDKLFLMMGSDAFLGFEAWYNWGSILSLCEIIVDQRPSDQLEQIMNHKKKLEKMVKKVRIYFCKLTQIDISSSGVRGNLKQGFDTSTMLDNQVLNYIKSNKIYS